MKSKTLMLGTSAGCRTRHGRLCGYAVRFIAATIRYSVPPANANIYANASPDSNKYAGTNADAEAWRNTCAANANPCSYATGHNPAGLLTGDG